MSIREKIGNLFVNSGVKISLTAPAREYFPGETIAGELAVRGGDRDRVISRIFLHLICHWRAESNVIRQGPQLPMDEIGRIFQARAGLEPAHSARYEVRENSGTVSAAGLILARDLRVPGRGEVNLPFEIKIPPEAVKLGRAVGWELLARGVFPAARAISAAVPVTISLCGEERISEVKAAKFPD
jgi:sporulation-control protein spo0M